MAVYVYIYKSYFLLLTIKINYYMLILVQSVKLNKYCVKLNIKTLFKIKSEIKTYNKKKKKKKNK